MRGRHFVKILVGIRSLDADAHVVAIFLLLLWRSRVKRQNHERQDAGGSNRDLDSSVYDSSADFDSAGFTLPEENADSRRAGAASDPIPSAEFSADPVFLSFGFPSFSAVSFLVFWVPFLFCCQGKKHGVVSCE